METLKRLKEKLNWNQGRGGWLTAASLLLSVSLCAQYNSWEAYEQAPSVTTFDRYFQEGVEAIKRGDMQGARDRLEAAQQEAANRKDKEAKGKARDALRRVKSFYAPLNDHLAQGDALMQQRSWKAAQMQFEAGQELVKKYGETDIKELEDIDRELGYRIDEETRQADNQRRTLIQEHFSRAEQYLYESAYEGVLAEVQEVRPLLFEERDARELERARELEDRAHYQQLMDAGQRSADNEDFNAALASYRAAQEFMDSYEVQEKQKEMESRLHYELLQQGQAAYLGGRYQDAADKLSEAASLRDSPYHQRIVQNAYSELKAKGDSALEQKQYDIAEQWYARARLFADGPGIREDISKAGTAADYDAKYARALSSIEAEKLKRARRQLRSAMRKFPTEEARQMIADIDAYYDEIKTGKRLLNQAPAEAWQRFDEARQLFPTDEIEQWMYKAREAAGGQVGKVDPSDFYN